MLVLGDAHAADPDNRAVLRETYRASDADVALQTGDLQHYRLPKPTYFVAGNDEDHDVIAALRAGESRPEASNAHLLAGEAVTVEGRRVAGLSGTYAPTRYEESRESLSGDRRRHFTEAEVDSTAALPDVDVLLAHEAPHGLLTVDGHDVGCRPMDDLLAELEPNLCLVGHHHEHAESTFGPTRVVALRPVWAGHYVLDPDTLALDAREPPG